MNYFLKYVLLLFSTVALFSCNSDIKIPSKISMKVGSGYTSNNGSTILVPLNSTINVGIIASKLETNTLLTTLEISNVFDASTTTTSYYVESLKGNDVNSFSKDFSFKTRGVVGIEKWIFTVTNTDGVTNQVYITLDVEDI